MHQGVALLPPRIPPVGKPDKEQRALLAKTLPGPDGKPLNVFLTLAHRPELMRRINALGGYFMVHGGLGAREREIVILRTAAHARSVYEIGQHRWIAARLGLSPGEIEAALDPGSAHGWSSCDRLLLDFTDELVYRDTITDGTWGALGGFFDDDQRVELLVLVGFYRMLAGALNSLRVDLDQSVADVLLT